MLHSFTSIIKLFSSEEVFLYNSLESLPHEQHSNPLILFSMCMLDIQDKKRRHFFTILYIFITSIHCANNRYQPSDQKNEDFYKCKETSLFISTMLSICIQEVEKQRRGHFFHSYNLIYRGRSEFSLQNHEHKDKELNSFLRDAEVKKIRKN